MIDYSNGIDYAVTNPLMIGEDLFILTKSPFNGYLFTKIPIIKNDIDIEVIKQNSYLWQRSNLSNLTAHFYWEIFHNSDNIDEKYNDIIGLLCK